MPISILHPGQPTNLDIAMASTSTNLQNSKESRGPEPIRFQGQWAKLFADNRKPMDTYMIKKVDANLDDGFLDLSLEEEATKFIFQPNFCIVGYFYDKFPGTSALKRLTDSWNLDADFTLHKSGWKIFHFTSENQLLSILQGGPYVVNNQILVIRRMLQFFDFAKEGRSRMLIWVCWMGLCLELPSPSC
ncbi:hypothetical protein Dimus_039468 [Dionaea muscipula]